MQRLPGLDYEGLAWSEDWQDHIEGRTALEEALDTLEPGERFVVLARLDGVTLADIGRDLRVSAEAARQIYELAIKRLQVSVVGWTPWRRPPPHRLHFLATWNE